MQKGSLEWDYTQTTVFSQYFQVYTFIFFCKIISIHRPKNFVWMTKTLNLFLFEWTYADFLVQKSWIVNLKNLLLYAYTYAQADFHFLNSVIKDTYIWHICSKVKLICFEIVHFTQTFCEIIQNIMHNKAKSELVNSNETRQIKCLLRYINLVLLNASLACDKGFLRSSNRLFDIMQFGQCSPSALSLSHCYVFPSSIILSEQIIEVKKSF